LHRYWANVVELEIGITVCLAKEFEVNACRVCFERAKSPEKVRDVFRTQFRGCDDCDHIETMRAVTNQYRMRLPRWWVVNNVIVVPMWIVESLRMSLAI
jgi:hypothetical protein